MAIRQMYQTLTEIAFLRVLIRDHKAELMGLLAADGWSPATLDAERRFGRWHARLYPFIGEAVSTPRGHGRLVQVFPERASSSPESRR
jgi:hypothetical protein